MKYTDCYLNDLYLAQSAIKNLHLMKNCNILVTGAGGLIGSAIVDFLLLLNDKQKLNITVFAGARNEEKLKKRFGEFANRKDFVFFRYDALEKLDTQLHFDFIIHTASPANPAAYINNPVETMLANLSGTQELLKYATTNNIKRFLFVSSSEVYGNKSTSDPYSENDYGFLDILNPRACYPSSKRAAETLCCAYNSEYNTDTVIVRPGHIYGPTNTPEDNRAATQFFNNVISGNDIIMKSAGTQLRSYCYVVDCVSAILCVLLNGKSAEAYNISNPSSIISIRELAGLIAKAGNKNVRFENPSDIELRSFNLMDNSSLDSKKLEELGWKNLFDAYTGIEHTYRILSEQEI